MKSVSRSHGPAILLALLFLALGTVYNLLTPVFEAPDEVWHFAYIRYVAQRADLPVQGANQGDELARQEASQPPLYYILAAPLVRLLDTSDFDRASKLNPYAAAGLPNSDGNKNMVVPTPVSSPWRGTVLAVHIVRFFSLLLGLVTILSTYALGRRLWSAMTGVVASAGPRRQESSHSTYNYLPLLLAAVVAFNPQFLFISASVNNDNVMTALASLAVALTVHLATDPPEWGLSYRRVATLGVVAGLAAISKLTGLLLLAFVVFGLSLAIWRRRDVMRGSRAGLPLLTWLACLGMVAMLTALIAGWWYARNWMLYHDVTGLRPMLGWVGERRLLLRVVAGELGGLELSFWAVFGWFNILVDEWIYTALKIVARLAALGLIVLILRWIISWRSRQSNNPRSSPTLQGSSASDSAPLNVCALGLAGLWVTIVMAGLVRWTATTPGTQGRLVFPAISCMAVLLLTGLSAFVPRRWQAPVLAIPVAGLFLLAVVVPFHYIAPAYTRPTVMSSSAAQPQHQVHLRYGDNELELLGYAVDREAALPGSDVEVTLYMQALRPIENDYSLFIHLWGTSMQWLGQRDSYPGRGSLPTSQMTPGAVVEDRYIVTIAPTATVPARVQIEIGFYDYESGQRLWATAPDGKRTELPFVGRMKVASPTPGDRSLRPSLFSFGQQAYLVSAQTETPPVVQAGSTITVVTTWQAATAIQQDYTIFLQMLDQKNTVVAQKDGQPQAGEYPTGVWDKGEIVTDRRTITLPAALAPGSYRLVTGLYVLASGERLPVSGPAGPVPENWAELGAITVR